MRQQDEASGDDDHDDEEEGEEEDGWDQDTLVKGMLRNTRVIEKCVESATQCFCSVYGRNFVTHTRLCWVLIAQCTYNLATVLGIACCALEQKMYVCASVAFSGREGFTTP